jgi:hypothetical protein
MRTVLPIGNTKLAWLRNARKIVEGTLSIVAMQPQAKDLHEKQLVYKKYLGRFLAHSPFSKISADSGVER